MPVVIKPVVKFDTAGVAMRIRKSVNEALPEVTEKIAKDCNDYAPQRYGNLIDTANINMEVSGLTSSITWRVPYASYVYKGLSKKGKPLKYSKYPNANAQKEWCKKAKSLKLAKWQDMINDAIKEHWHDK